MKRSDGPDWRKDGQLSFELGVDMGKPPAKISSSQLAYLSNGTCRNGEIKHRGRFIRRNLTFSNNIKAAFLSGFFQEASGYNGADKDSLLCSHGGRQFKIDIDTEPGTITTTTGNFFIPAIGNNVTVLVDDSSNLDSQGTTIVIGGYKFFLISIDTEFQITVRNDDPDNVGISVAAPADVTIPDTWEVSEITPTARVSTTTTGPFVIPSTVSGVTAALPVLNSAGFVQQLPLITVGGYLLEIVSVDSPIQITVRNKNSSDTGIPIASGSDVIGAQLDANNPNQLLNWSIQAENYWILQDNQAYAVIFDGTVSRRANPARKELPVGNVMCYQMARVSVALPDRRTYRIGDILYSPDSGTPALGYKDSILRFTENDFLNEGGDLVARVFGAPSNSGDILSMKAGAMLDSALGQGPMVVGTPNVMFSVQLPFDRTTWKDLSNPLQTVNPIKGPSGQNSTVLHNTDQWYRSIDGIRSYILAQRQANALPANTPQSSELDDFLDDDTEMWLEFGSGVIFDNRLLMTLSPQMTDHGCYHRAMAVLDFNLSSTLQGKLPPAWEGFWTGLRVLRILTILVNKKERCFIFALNGESEIELWELSGDDGVGDDDGVPIVWDIQFRNMNCGDSDEFKKLKAFRAIVTDLSGSVTAELDYRSDESACWNPWDVFSICARAQDCGPFNCSGPVTYQEQARYPLRAKEPPDTFDDITKKKKSTGYGFQPRLKMTGSCTLAEVRIYALPEPESLGIEKQNET